MYTVRTKGYIIYGPKVHKLLLLEAYCHLPSQLHILTKITNN